MKARLHPIPLLQLLIRIQIFFNSFESPIKIRRGPLRDIDRRHEDGVLGKDFMVFCLYNYPDSPNTTLIIYFTPLFLIYHPDSIYKFIL